MPTTSSIAYIMDQSLTSALAPAFVDAIRARHGRGPRLKDVVEAVFAYDCPDDDKPGCVSSTGQSTAAWSSYHTPDPLAGGGTEPSAASLTAVRPLQGTVFKTRVTSTPIEGGAMAVFDTVGHGGLGLVSVPVKMNVVGRFVETAEDGTPAPLRRRLKFGWNLISPHTREAAPFNTAFSDLVAPELIATRAISFIREVTVGFGGSISGAVVQEFAIATWSGTVRPEFAYWVRVNPVPAGVATPTLGHDEAGLGQCSRPIRPKVLPPPQAMGRPR